MKSELFPGLADIAFAERDPAAIEAAIITAYEDRSGRTLAKGDPVRLLLESVALYIIQQRHLIDFTGKQNTLAYAEGDFLEHLGALLAVSRLAPARAVTTLKFTLSDAMPQAVVIPEGTRVKHEGEVQPKGGVVMIAMRTGAPLLPVYVGKPNKLFHKTHIVFGEPYEPKTASRHGTAEEYQAYADEIVRRAYDLGREQP